MRVLLIEDENTDVSLLAAELVSCAAVDTFVHVHDASEAIEILNSPARRPDIVVLDLLLADGESGFQVLRFLHHRIELPVIIWTQCEYPILRDLCAWFGVCAYIPKTNARQRNVVAVREAIEDCEHSRFAL